MAFSVTPTSGNAPYVFTANISNKANLMPGYYSLEFRGVGAVGSCPSDGIPGNNIPLAVEQIMATNSYTQVSPNVMPGACRVSTLIIRDLKTNSIVSQSTVQVSNL